MGKSNAERQAEYRLRQKAVGEKKRLNIWLSPAAHKRLGLLTKQQEMSQQALIEWLLTSEHLSAQVHERLDENSVPVMNGLLCNQMLSGGDKKHKGRKSKRKKLPGNNAAKVIDREEFPEDIAQQKLEFPSQFELEL